MPITIKGLKSLRTKLNNLGGDSTQALLQAMKTTVLLAQADARRNAPASKYSQADSSGSASLKGSIQSEAKVVPSGVEGRVYTNAGHAVFVEFGTGPVGAANQAGVSPRVPVAHTTRERWAFPIVIKGEQTFRMTSGQPARPYLYPAAVNNKDTLNEQCRRELVNALRRIAGKGGG